MMLVDGSRVVVQLWDWQADFASFLIIERPGTGVWYSNQVGGTACDHPEVEGVLIPIPHQFECDAIYDRWPCALASSGLIIEAICLSLSDFAERSKFRLAFDVDRASQPNGLAEAWVPVTLLGVPSILGEGLAQLIGAKGWLTYPNSD